jgi:cytochrome c6
MNLQKVKVLFLKIKLSKIIKLERKLIISLDLSKILKQIILISLLFILGSKDIKAENFNFDSDNKTEIGKKLFISNCNVCHINGNNIIIPEKNLKKETLERNGINKLDAIVYQIVNGKNGMPAFGGRLEESQIQEIAKYILSTDNFNF